MTRYIVTFTRSASYTVEADDADHAYDLARDREDAQTVDDYLAAYCLIESDRYVTIEEVTA